MVLRTKSSAPGKWGEGNRGTLPSLHSALQGTVPVKSGRNAFTSFSVHD